MYNDAIAKNVYFKVIPESYEIMTIQKTYFVIQLHKFFSNQFLSKISWLKYLRHKL